MDNKKKNIMIISADQWSAGYLGCAGNQEILTPSIDELAHYGIRFTNAVSNTPVCIPARREFLLGVSSKTHGDRCFNTKLPMPRDIPTLAQVLRDNGYQAFCTGKLHVYPQRDRCGFDDVHLMEEGRHLGSLRQDDYERYLAQRGYAGLEFAHGMCNNNYFYRPFHLPEDCHPTTWATRDMCEQIKRRDPGKPSFWYLSFTAPHPPYAPLKDYLDMYRDVPFEGPWEGDWTNRKNLPFGYQYYRNLYHIDTKRTFENAKRAYYALCTQIDHQLRLVIGTLREEGILEDTIILFFADHGEMLGSQHLWGKFLMYENSVRIPMILVPTTDSGIACGVTDDRLVELKDVMPTLLEMVGIPVPEHVEGHSMVGKKSTREYSYGELWEDDRATRMIMTKDFKLVYYLVGNTFQLFDLVNDPHEMHDLADDVAYQGIRDELTGLLIENLYGSDLSVLKNGLLVGYPAKDYAFYASLQDGNKLFQGRDMLLQRGIR